MNDEGDGCIVGRSSKKTAERRDSKTVREESDMDDVVVKRSRRPLHKGWYVLLAIVLALAIALGFFFVLRANGIKRRLARLRAAGQPTNFAELAEYTKLPEGAENAADTYLEAFYTYFPPVDEANTPVIGKAQLPGRGQPLTEPMVEAISKCLEDNKKCLELLREAGGIEHCRYEWDYSAAAAPHLSEMRKCAMFLKLAAIFYSDKGDTDAAIGYIKDGLRLSDSLVREPMLIGYLVRIATIAVPISGLERTLCVTSLSDQQLRQLDEMFSKTRKTLDLSEVLVTEQCFMIESFRNPSMLSGMQGRIALLKIPLIGKTGLIDTLDYMADSIEAAKLPGTQRITRFLEIEKEMQNLSFLHIIIKMLAPAMNRIGELDLRVRSNLDLAQTALAIERYRLAKGDLPERLEQLVPQYLEKVPIDPYDDKPLRYKRTEPGYVLYSIGEDRKDNGGKEKDRKKSGEPYDFPFIVTR